jgi:hypothetical protein
MAKAMRDSPPSRSMLTDPEGARYAWARFRRLLGWAGVAALAVSGLAIALIYRDQGEIGWVTILAILGGVGGSVMMGGALMGLVFLSSGTGHDEDVERIDP